jgi:hypothetical protein
VSPEDIGRMTIAELEAASTRVAAALKVLREAGAWKPPADTKPAAAPQWYAIDEPAQPPAPQRPPAPAVRWSPSELAERERLLKQMRPEFPPEIAALEES